MDRRWAIFSKTENCVHDESSCDAFCARPNATLEDCFSSVERTLACCCCGGGNRTTGAQADSAYMDLFKRERKPWACPGDMPYRKWWAKQTGIPLEEDENLVPKCPTGRTRITLPFTTRPDAMVTSPQTTPLVDFSAHFTQFAGKTRSPKHSCPLKCFLFKTSAPSKIIPL